MRLKHDIGKLPSGYIYGMGAGNIFSLGLLFDSEDKPKAILSVDLLPDAVLTGRTVVELIRNSDSFDSFIIHTHSYNEFRKAVGRVINNESDSIVRNALKGVDVQKLFDTLYFATDNIPTHTIVDSRRIKDMISVPAAIRENWVILKKLADERNIGFGLVNFYDPSISSYVQALPGFRNGRNIIYTSNLIDYTFDESFRKSADPRWESFQRKLREFNHTGNLFIYTTKECDLDLYAHWGLPKSAPKGFWLV
jgi:hypothetical protein